MTISYWNTNHDFMTNAKANILASSLAQGSAFSKVGNVVDRFGVEGNFVGSIQLLPYVYSTYGASTPVCLGDRIIREIHRILLQIRDEADRLVGTIDDFLDNTIPFWDEAGGVWEVFQDEVLTQFEDEILKPLETGLKDGWNDFTDWVSNPC